MILADANIVIGAFSGVGTGVILLLSPAAFRGARGWLAKRRTRRDASTAAIVERMRTLETRYLQLDEAMKKVIVFIEGSPDPYLKNPDGSPVVTGGLLSFMTRIEAQLRDANKANGL